MTTFDERQRQAALLDAIDRRPAEPRSLRLREPADRAALGLAVYRGQADATATQALANIFPTLQAMLGAADFERLASEFRLETRPLRGDLGEWGGDLPAFIGSHRGLLTWPWLADSARLDLAVHRSERAADAAFDAESLALLATTHPALLRFDPMPGSALLRSPWPIVAIHAAHRLVDGTSEADHAFRGVAAAIAARHGECAWVVRCGWRAAVHGVSPLEAGWIESLLGGDDVALRRAGAGFGFAAWLAEAVAAKQLRGVVRLAG